jgi:hypothetical protein
LVNLGHATQAAHLGAMEVTDYRVFTIEELEDATNNFDCSNLIQDVAQGQVSSFNLFLFPPLLIKQVSPLKMHMQPLPIGKLFFL